MASISTTVDAPSTGDCDQSGYFWDICTWTTPSYSGCCNVDPCQSPIGCPQAENIPNLTITVTSTSSEEVTIITETETVPSSISTLTITRSSRIIRTSKTSKTSKTPTISTTSTTPIPSSVSSSSTPTPGAGALTSPTSSATSTAASESSGGHGMTVSVSSLVGIVIGCSFFAIFVSLSAFWWWSRRRRRKSEKQEEAEAHAQAERLASSGDGDEPVPPGLESIFSPMAQAGPGSVFDRTEGRMGKGESMLGFSPLAHGQQHHSGTSASGAHSSLASPLTAETSWAPGLPSSPSELDSTQVHEAGTVPGPWSETTELDSRPVPPVEAEEGLRATLNSTQEEREAGMYANSWTRFQDVQL
ncbi:hypothetical protein N657DRAFT_13667 [Parathielavia appendiculata]|uniref:Uncharacterized protein n=1 Tax=Parathielavia appendiculata TaxID=2587402 RepID=A0AAN6U8B2_9PEZI|nr:hypothetical protein N657DRAFT_13667 [Parathielavia appendiculata]